MAICISPSKNNIVATTIQGNEVFCLKNDSDTFTVRINCASDLKNFEKSWPLASNLQYFFLLTQTIFSQSRSDQFLKQNTIDLIMYVFFSLL